MQKRQSIKNIQSGTPVDSVFILAAATMQQSRNGPYWKIVLKDAAGTINANIWSPLSQDFTSLPVGELVSVSASTSMFRDQIQLNITQIAPLDDAEKAQLDMADFMASTPYNINDMWDALLALCHKECTHQPWHTFVTSVLDDPAVKPLLRSMPAAKSIHHAYAGGLLEHTLSVATLTMRLADHYPHVDRQVLLAGALFHDMGKIWEFSGGINNDYSDDGRLLGHITLVLEFLAPYLHSSGLEPALVSHFKHLIVSHHGSYEFGSPRLPQTAEAFLLHYADNIDAKMQQCKAPFVDTEDGYTGWSPWQSSLERQLYQPYRTPHASQPLFAAADIATDDAFAIPDAPVVTSISTTCDTDDEPDISTTTGPEAESQHFVATQEHTTTALPNEVVASHIAGTDCGQNTPSAQRLASTPPEPACLIPVAFDDNTQTIHTPAQGGDNTGGSTASPVSPTRQHRKKTRDEQCLSLLKV